MIECLGEIRTGVNAYYDSYQEDQKFLIGYRKGVINFIIGNSKDLSLYVKALENYDKKSNQSI
jgi:hypothetical protein